MTKHDQIIAKLDEVLSLLRSPSAPAIQIAADVPKKSAVASSSVTEAPNKPESRGAVWILRGSQCRCKGCQKLVYEVIEDVYDKVTIEEIQQAFKPLNGAPVIPEGVSLYGDPHGNLAIDCPLCSGTKTLWIRGDGEYEGVLGG